MGYSGSLLVVIKSRGYKVKGLMILNFRVYNNYKFGIKELAVYRIIRAGWYYGYDYIRVIVYGLYMKGVITFTYKSGWE
jgi:hypothetical protein